MVVAQLITFPIIRALLIDPAVVYRRTHPPPKAARVQRTGPPAPKARSPPQVVAGPPAPKARSPPQVVAGPPVDACAAAPPVELAGGARPPAAHLRRYARDDALGVQAVLLVRHLFRV